MNSLVANMNKEQSEAVRTTETIAYYGRRWFW